MMNPTSSQRFTWHVDVEYCTTNCGSLNHATDGMSKHACNDMTLQRDDARI